MEGKSFMMEVFVTELMCCYFCVIRRKSGQFDPGEEGLGPDGSVRK